MDETEDHEPRVANVSESTITLTTVVTTTTSTETRIRQVIEGQSDGEAGETEEEDAGACELGDVMVEVLGPDVLVDGVRRHNGEVGSGQRDDGVRGENLGDGGKVNDSAVLRDGALGRLQDKDRVVEVGIERGMKRKSCDEGRVAEMGSAGAVNELREDSVSHNVEVRRDNEIGNGVRHSTSQITLVADGNKDDNAAESVDAVKEEGENKSVKVVERASAVLESRTKENVILEKGNKETVSASNIRNQASELTVGSSIVESKIPDLSIAGSLEAETDAGHRREGNGESKGLSVHERLALGDGSLIKFVDGQECQAEPSERGCLDGIEGLKDQVANAENVSLVGTTSHSEDKAIKLPDPVTSLMDKQHMQVEGRIHMVNENLNMGLVLLETEVPDVSMAASTAANLVVSSKLDGNEESESHATHGLPVLVDESLVEVVNPEECTSTIDTSAMEEVAKVGSNMVDVQEMREDVEVSEQVESPEVQEEDDELDSDLMERQSNDENEEHEGHTALGLAHLPDESFVEDEDQGNNLIPETSLVHEHAMVGFAQTDSDMEDSQEVQDEMGFTEQLESPNESEEDEEPVSHSTKSRSKREKNARRGHVKSGNLVKDHQVSYQLPPENEDEFSVFDLVWGKVKSHPWWPGQIFHPFDSSDKAKKYIRKDCYLVAYFGDKSFAWNEGSVLKPFFKHFSQEEKQSNSESFQNAVTCALEEVSRRVELGLACSCISEEVYDKIKYQIVENAGIREESSKREGVDWSTGVNSFQPNKLLEYIRTVALSPTSGTSRLDLVMAKAQLLAFNRLKGCDGLPDFQHYDELTECDANTAFHAERGETDLVDSVAEADSKTRLKGSHKRKHNLKDIVYQRRKEKSLTELMGETMYYFDGDFDSPEEDDFMLSSPTSGAKRKASLHLTDDFSGQQSTKTISLAKVSNIASPNPQQSFKVGECIRRVASQLTGSSSIMKIAGDETDSKHQVEDADEVCDHPSMPEEIIAPKEEASTDEMLSQLHLSAQDPMKGYSFLADVVSFFSEFRNLAVSTQRQKMRKGSGKKRKTSVPVTGASETFEFDDRNDSYWTDMVVQNNSEAKPSRRGRKRKEDRLPSGDPDKPLKSNPRKYSRKQYFHGNHEAAAEIPSENEKPQEQLPTGPTELVLSFSEVGSIPSEVNLNKMFRRFGPLKESETEIDVQSGRAKVVFKKRSDAEVAYSSATMFNIFGSTLVNYQLNYTPSVPFRSAPLAVSDVQKDAT